MRKLPHERSDPWEAAVEIPAPTVEVRLEAGRRNLEVAVALVAGPAVSGTTTWGSQPHYALTGESVQALEGLLRVAQSGSLLLSSSVRQELEALRA